MGDPNLSPGDRVVDLAFLLRSSAVVTGTVAAAISLWVLKQIAFWTLAGGLLGGIVGFLVGTLLGLVFFPASAGKIVVVKLGPGALVLACKAALIGGITSGILAGLVPAVLLAGISRITQLVGVGVGIGIVVGATFAYLATRP